jgi:hypothetical membrane protein
MKRNLLLAYQLLTGLSDTGTGLALLFAPALTLQLMGLHAEPLDLTLLSYIGAFVLSTGLACLYGATLIRNPELAPKLEVVWLLTAVTRTLVALFVLTHVLDASLEHGWITVALTDGLFALLQLFGLAKGWLRHAHR